MAKIGRNQPCPCGSGKKYKHCCWRRDRAAHVPTTPAVSPHGYYLAETGLDRLSNSVVGFVEEGRLDEADAACEQLRTQYPEVHDWLMRKAMICEARGETTRAIELLRTHHRLDGCTSRRLRSGKPRPLLPGHRTSARFAPQRPLSSRMHSALAMNTQTAAIAMVVAGCTWVVAAARTSQRDDERRCGGDQEAERGVDGITNDCSARRGDRCRGSAENRAKGGVSPERRSTKVAGAMNSRGSSSKRSTKWRAPVKRV